MTISARIAVMMMVIGLLAAGCGGSDDAAAVSFDTDSERTVSTAAPTTTIATEFASPSAEAGGGAAAPTDAQAVVETLDPADLGRSIIYTANLVVEVDDVVVAGEQVKLAIAGLGGILFGQETTTGRSARSVLTIKVRPQDFDEAIDRLSGIGTLVSQTIYADDVTDRVVDLESRITTAEASVERLRSFLEGATDLEDVAILEQELLRRETDLELLRGQLRTLEDAVALATIVIVLTEPDDPAPEALMEVIETAYFGHDDGATCPGADDVAVDEGDPVTLCYLVRNVGTTALSAIEIRDRSLDARPADYIVVAGDPSVAVQPGEHVILALEIEADYPGYTNPSVSATAVGADGDPLRREVQVEIEELRYSVEEDTSLPGFGDALSAAWRTLQTGFGFIVLAAGAALPFLWVPLLLAALWYWQKRRQAHTPPSPPEPEAADDPDAPAEEE